MRIFTVCAVILFILTNNSCADKWINQNLITQYDPGEIPIDSVINPQLSSYAQIISDDQLDHNSERRTHITFEDQTQNKPLTFEVNPIEDEYTNIDNDDNIVHFGQNNNIINTEGVLGDETGRNSGNKIKFEGSKVNDDFYRSDNNGINKLRNDNSQVVFNEKEENEGYDDHDSDQEGSTAIKFENSNKPNFSTKNVHSEKITQSGRVIFEDNSNYQETDKKKKRKPRKKSGFQTLNNDSTSLSPKKPYPFLNHPENGETSYPIYGYGGPKGSNSGYPGLTYDYPGYPSLYPKYPSYLRYPQSPGSRYPSPANGLYLPSGYQGSGESGPQTDPVNHSSSGQEDNSGYTDSRYPIQKRPGSSIQGAVQIGKPGALHQEYLYYQRYPIPGYPAAYPGIQNAQYLAQNQANYVPGYYGAPGYQNGQYRPQRPSKSLTQRAISAVTEALTSIALYDDQQCVPRLLCEVASGSLPSSSTLLKATAGLQPLLTLLQSYNGVSSSPLFVFGRAAVLGMAAKGNPWTCLRAYHQCPTDPEKLINYLNNHNGGFFRFFGQPETSQKQQNLEQFYNYLSGQNGNQQKPAFQKYPNSYGDRLQNQNNVYSQNYGNKLNSQQTSIRVARDTEIEERIQNKPGFSALENEDDESSVENQDSNSKWLFPDDVSTKNRNERENSNINERESFKIEKQYEIPQRFSRTLKFPDDRRINIRPGNYDRKYKNIYFPGSYIQNSISYQTTTPVNSDEYVFDHKHNFYVKKPKAVSNDDVVYVVRGNGDPNHPEIVKIRPGQSVSNIL